MMSSYRTESPPINWRNDPAAEAFSRSRIVHPPALPSLTQASAAGNLERVTQLVQGTRWSTEDLASAFDAAVQGCHLDVALHLLENGAPFRNSVPAPAVRMALNTRSSSLLQALIAHGWNVREHDGSGEVALQIAIQPHYPDFDFLVVWLLDQGADPNEGMGPWPGRLNPQCGAALENAVRWGTVATLDLLLEHGAKIEIGRPLQAAASSDKPDSERIPMIEHLISIGVDVNAPDRGGPYRPKGVGTALQHAVEAGKLERAKLLLEHGADPNIPNPQFGQKPIESLEYMRDQSLKPAFVDLLNKYM